MENLNTEVTQYTSTLTSCHLLLPQPLEISCSPSGFLPWGFSVPSEGPIRETHDHTHRLSFLWFIGNTTTYFAPTNSRNTHQSHGSHFYAGATGHFTFSRMVLWVFSQLQGTHFRFSKETNGNLLHKAGGKQVSPTSPTFTGVRQGTDPQHTISIFNHISSHISTLLSVPWTLLFPECEKGRKCEIGS